MPLEPLIFRASCRLTLVGGGTYNINTVGISGTSVFPGILVDGSTVISMPLARCRGTLPSPMAAL
jgi:hypothetical protein